MSIYHELISHYCESYSTKGNPALADLENLIALNHHDPGLASDFIQGRILSFISKLIGPRNILEIGTFLGYSTICLAEGLNTEGKIDTLEKETFYKSQLENIINDAGLTSKVNIIFGHALDSLKELDIATYDLFFIDAAKREYPRIL